MKTILITLLVAFLATSINAQTPSAQIVSHINVTQTSADMIMSYSAVMPTRICLEYTQDSMFFVSTYTLTAWYSGVGADTISLTGLTPGDWYARPVILVTPPYIQGAKYHFETEHSPTIITQPISKLANVGSNVTFSAVARGVPTPTYQWWKNSSILGGATNSSLNLLNVQFSDSGNYFCVISNYLGTMASSAAKLTVRQSPVITLNPASATLLAGQNLILNSAASGLPTPSCIWQFNGANIPNSTNSTLTINNTVISNSGLYRAIYTNILGKDTTFEVLVTIRQSPQFTLDPVSQTVNAGTTVNFTIAATGNPNPAFQWRKGGVNLLGQVSNTLVLNNVQLSDTGNYDCVATNVVGSATSLSAHLAVHTVPSVTLNPISQTVNAGVNVTFTASASGVPAPACQWYYGSGIIQGATNTSLILNNVSLANVGAYYAVFTNCVGQATTVSVNLVVHTMPLFTLQPVSLTVNAGQSASITASASGVPTPNYQWQKKVGLNWVNVPGATSSNLSANNVSLANAGDYRCLASNIVGSDTSNVATLTVQTPPTVTLQFANINAVEGNGNNVFIVATISGVPTPVIYWRFNGANIPGANDDTLIIANVSTANQGNYSVEAINVVDTALSSTTTLNVYTHPQITLQPISLTVNAGANATFTVASSGNPNPTYQWRRNGANIFGATSASYTINNCSANNSGSYDCIASNLVGSDTSNIANLVVQTLPSVSSQPANLILVEGDTAIFISHATGVPTPSVSWNFDGSIIPGVNGDTLIIYNVTSIDAGNYSATFSNVVGNATSHNANLTVRAHPHITVEPPTSITVNAGSLASVSLTATGNPNPNYQWQKRNGLNWFNVIGATNPTLSVNNVSPLNAGDYRCLVSNIVGSDTSVTVTLTVQTIPTVSNIANQIAVEGNNVMLIAVVAGNPTPNISWRFNGQNILGENNDTLVLYNVSLANQGNYSVEVSNVVDTVFSNSANLTVHTHTHITLQPNSDTVNVGANVTFIVAASGNPNPTYQWQKKNTFGLWVNIPGATSSILSLNNVTLADATDYKCIATNIVSSDISSVATLTVYAGPQVTLDPASQTLVGGQAITLTAAASGTPVPTVIWQFNGNNILGATNTTLTINNSSSVNAGSYRAIFTNCVGSDTTASAVITIQYVPVFTFEPMSDTVNAGQSASFVSLASGEPAPSYQWQKKNGLIWTNIPGATSSNLFSNNVSPANAGSYRSIATNIIGSDTSDVATLTVYTGPSITLQPINDTVIEGQSAMFVIHVAGSPAPVIYWRFNGTNIPGANDDTLILNNVLFSNAGSYDALLMNVADTIASSSAALIVYTAPHFTIQPVSRNVAEGDSVAFKCKATGFPTPNYQWYKDSILLPGETDTILILNGVGYADEGGYKCMAYNDADSVFSNTATLSVNSKPYISSSPQSDTVVKGNTATFSVSVNGTPPFHYVWKKGNATVGTNSPTLTLSNVNEGDAGNYWCIVNNSYGVDTSDTASLTIWTHTLITLQPVSKTVASGNNVSFTTASYAVPAAHYQWRKNGTAIAGATSATLSILLADSSDIAAYDCRVGNEVDTVFTQGVLLDVISLPQIISFQTSDTLYEGGNGVLTVDALGSNLSYLWKKDGILIPDEVGNNLIIANVGSRDEGVYTVYVSNEAGTISASCEVTVAPPPPFTSVIAQSFTQKGMHTLEFDYIVSSNDPGVLVWIAYDTIPLNILSPTTTPVAAGVCTNLLKKIILRDLLPDQTYYAAAIYINSDGVKDTSEVLKESVTSSEEVSLSKEVFNIYPNPVENQLNVFYSGASKATMSICDAVGKEIISYELSKKENVFQRGSINPGVYIYTLMVGNKKTTGRLIFR